MPGGFEPGVDLILTPRCNLACSYCYEAGRSPCADLPWEAAEAAIDLVLLAHPPSARVGFTGGEPFLAAPLLFRCVAHARRCAPPETGLTFSASTNGTLVDDALARFLAENDFDLQVSWDGAAQELRAPGTSATVEAGVRRLAAADPGWFRRRVRVAFTLTPENLPLLAASVETFLAAGIRNVVVAPAEGIAWPSAERIETELDRAFAGVVKACSPFVLLGEEVPVSVLRPPAVHTWSEEELCPCAAASPLSFAVAPDGVAWGCSTFATSMQRLGPAGLEVARALRLGDVRDPELPRRLEALPGRCAEVPALTHRRSRRSPFDDCASCALLPSCAPCPAAGARAVGNDEPTLVPAADCALARSAARARALLPRPLPDLVRDLADFAARLETLTRAPA